MGWNIGVRHKRKYKTLSKKERFIKWMFRYDLSHGKYRVVKVGGYGKFTVDDLLTNKRYTIKIPWWKSLI